MCHQITELAILEKKIRIKDKHKTRRQKRKKKITVKCRTGNRYPICHRPNDDTKKAAGFLFFLRASGNYFYMYFYIFVFFYCCCCCCFNSGFGTNSRCAWSYSRYSSRTAFAALRRSAARLSCSRDWVIHSSIYTSPCWLLAWRGISWESEREILHTVSYWIWKRRPTPALIFRWFKCKATAPADLHSRSRTRTRSNL